MSISPEEARLIGYCGLYCHRCDWFTGEISDTAKKLLDMLEKYKAVGLLLEEHGICDVEELKRGLDWISKNAWCTGCKPGGGWPDCPVRACCVERGLSYCSECGEFPCAKFQEAPFDKCLGLLKELAELRQEEWIRRRWG